VHIWLCTLLHFAHVEHATNCDKISQTLVITTLKLLARHVLKEKHARCSHCHSHHPSRRVVAAAPPHRPGRRARRPGRRGPRLSDPCQGRRHGGPPPFHQANQNEIRVSSIYTPYLPNRKECETNPKNPLLTSEPQLRKAAQAAFHLFGDKTKRDRPVDGPVLRGASAEMRSRGTTFWPFWPRG